MNRLLRVSLLGLLLAPWAGTLVGCAGDAPTSQVDSAIPPGHDFGGGAQVDQQVWPDTTPGALDGWPLPGDGYSAAPFGCQTDADCFGRLCCPTPWGVKLCGDRCPR